MGDSNEIHKAGHQQSLEQQWWSGPLLEYTPPLQTHKSNAVLDNMDAGEGWEAIKPSGCSERELDASRARMEAEMAERGRNRLREHLIKVRSFNCLHNLTPIVCRLVARSRPSATFVTDTTSPDRSSPDCERKLR
jgi:hypothetical protein